MESYDYTDYQNKSKNELLSDYVENNGVNEYFYALHRDSNNLNSGYILCPDCGFFIPVGNVSNLIPEEYLCNCSFCFKFCYTYLFRGKYFKFCLL